MIPIMFKRCAGAKNLWTRMKFKSGLKLKKKCVKSNSNIFVQIYRSSLQIFIVIFNVSRSVMFIINICEYLQQILSLEKPFNLSAMQNLINVQTWRCDL